MKKLLMLPLLAASLIFAGCNDDDDDGSNGGPPAGPNTIVGTWQYSSFVTVFDSGDGTTSEQVVLTGGCDPTPMLVLTEEGEFTADDVQLSTDQDANFTCESGGEQESGTYELIDGNTYRMVYVDGDDTFEDDAEITLSNNNNTLSVASGLFGGSFVVRYTRQ